MTGMDALAEYYLSHLDVLVRVFEDLFDRDIEVVEGPREVKAKMAANGTVTAFNKSDVAFEEVLDNSIPEEDHVLVEEMCMYAFIEYIPPDSLTL